MIELKILQIGLCVHLVGQIYFAYKTSWLKSSVKTLLLSNIAFLLIGSVLTIINLNSNENFGECGTKRFNPLIMVTIWGNFLNIVLYSIITISLTVINKVKKHRWKKH